MTSILQRTSTLVWVARPLVRRYATQQRQQFRNVRDRLESMAARKDTSAPGTTGLGAISVGKGAVAAGGALGLGALCVYGLGFGSAPSALDRSVAWAPHVRERVRTTYMYVGVGLATTAASALACLRTPALTRVFYAYGWKSLVAGIALSLGAGIAVQMVPYQEGFGAKQLAWLGFSGAMGLLISPTCLLGGALVARAAAMTAGIVGGLSAVAACAPDGKFLAWGGGLGMGLGVVVVSSLGSAFLGATPLGIGLYSVSLYGGLLLFSGFLLYDTHKVIYKSENFPVYDPVNSAIGIYMDTLNIFIRIAQILSSGGGKKK